MATLNILEYSKIVATNETLLEYLRNNNLLVDNYICCRTECYKVKDKGSDGEIFKCKRCYKRKSVRVNSFFYGSKLALNILFTILYFFAQGLPVHQTLRFLQNKVSKKTFIQWYTYCREVCSLFLIHEPQITLGLNSAIVHLDDSFLGHIPKYFIGAWRGQQYILFGIIDTTTKKCVVEVVPDAKRETLLPIIQRHNFAMKNGKFAQLTMTQKHNHDSNSDSNTLSGATPVRQ